ncbi:predicted protein [Sclerotinia sclerotiorum 1980 UF-70]|uniref:Uncharacterized protein n=1 Tax=Sclerotinia sclerotiorum (strain ATCC 18683 / 1980 / Ss-1) TaxID=665079 RepID=A7EPP1_SCLS1|nr:predicted protein [Sclerotinia sclerotiorum 1980 UF-70]EDO04807.1 predicted protein [Sclerotinia sclerotiorum 1980 UF-70]
MESTITNVTLVLGTLGVLLQIEILLLAFWVLRVQGLASSAPETTKIRESRVRDKQQTTIILPQPLHCQNNPKRKIHIAIIRINSKSFFMHNKRAKDLANWAKLLKIAEEDLESNARTEMRLPIREPYGILHVSIEIWQRDGYLGFFSESTRHSISFSFEALVPNFPSMSFYRQSLASSVAGIKGRHLGQTGDGI